MPFLDMSELKSLCSSPITSKNLESVADMPELTKQKIQKNKQWEELPGHFQSPLFQLYVFLGLFIFA
jgi:hypothetical protein